MSGILRQQIWETCFLACRSGRSSVAPECASREQVHSVGAANVPQAVKPAESHLCQTIHRPFSGSWHCSIGAIEAIHRHFNGNPHCSTGTKAAIHRHDHGGNRHCSTGAIEESHRHHSGNRHCRGDSQVLKREPALSNRRHRGDSQALLREPAVINRHCRGDPRTLKRGPALINRRHRGTATIVFQCKCLLFLTGSAILLNSAAACCDPVIAVPSVSLVGISKSTSSKSARRLRSRTSCCRCCSCNCRCPRVLGPAADASPANMRVLLMLPTTTESDPSGQAYSKHTACRNGTERKKWVRFGGWRGVALCGAVRRGAVRCDAV